MATYPVALGHALVRSLWEADFPLDNARKAVSRADTVYVAGCLFRVLLLCLHALDGSAGRVMINEQGEVESARLPPGAPPCFVTRAHDVLAHLRDKHGELEAAIDVARSLLIDVRAACDPPR